LERYGRDEPASLNRLRDEARAIAPELGLNEELSVLDGLIGTLLGTHDVKLSSARARATASGVRYDPVRIERFRELAIHLLATGLPEVAEGARHDVSVFGFFESYFSNYIEGTEFTLEQAADIVFRGAVPPQRPQDAHEHPRYLPTRRGRLRAQAGPRQRRRARARPSVSTRRDAR
jgi:hypothetical protein